MGANASSSSSSAGESAKDRKISREMQAKKRQDEEQVKLLLLGTGESGKSTIFKQMKILYGVPWTQQELVDLRPTVYSNVVTNVRSVLKHVRPTLQPAELHPIADEFISESIPDDAELTPAIGRKIKQLWASQQVQQAWRDRSAFQVLDCLEYYMRDIDRVCAGPEVYVPTQQDVLQARVRTSGICEERYIVDGVPFIMFDVGGQRNERKKWIHAFQEVTSVIFVAAINEYDQVLFEDKKTNRLDEALKLFEEICNSPFFVHTSMILFLNKNDLFRAKLQAGVPFRVPGVRHDDFNGPYAENQPGGGAAEFEKCVAAAHAYISQLFINRKPDAARTLYIHVTEATDTKQTFNVLSSCKDVIMRGSLKNNGFME